MGYYIKARAIKDSSISRCPPHFREIWDYLLREANHKDVKYNGFIVKRGQLFRSVTDIREDMHWNVGWRKITYKKHECENAMKYLRQADMIATTRAVRGAVITIINYDTYQNPKLYKAEENAELHDTHEPERSRTINKNERMKEERKNKKEIFSEPDPLKFPYLADTIFNSEFSEYLKGRKRKATNRAIELALTDLHSFNKETAILMIQNSIKNGWIGIFPIKDSINIQQKKEKRERTKTEQIMDSRRY